MELIPFTDEHIIVFLRITQWLPINVQVLLWNMTKEANRVFADDVKHLTLRYRIERYSDKWEWTHLSSNPNITLRIVLENRRRPWDWENLSANKGIPVKDIIKHPELPWAHSRFVSIRATFDEVRENMDWDWDWPWLICLLSIYDYSYLRTINHDNELIKTAIRDRDMPYMVPNLISSTLTEPTPTVTNCGLDTELGTFQRVCRSPQTRWNWPKLSKDPKMLLIRNSDPDFQHYRRLSIIN